ncbi:hypothetical protein KR074_011947 [Drosophila pseudoananassae]|nr:hypothetical protein KR074_011947 [Drosophila pseudoananassae]
MHFWIDKRSQQCGFGRSRVAASLSHAGGGLNYAHPPRRSKTTSCNQPAVHRSLPQTPYDIQPGTSRQSQYGNNNLLHGQQQNLLPQHSSTSNNNNANMGTSHLTTTGTATASNNNNANGTASSAAVLTGSGTIIPLVARGSHHHPHNTRHQPRSQQQLVQQHQHQQAQQQNQPYQHYSYHHPQFGNMAVPVRQHQHQQQLPPQQPHSGNVYADDAYSTYHHAPSHQHHSSNYISSASSNIRQSNAYATPRRHNSSSNMRHPATAAVSPTPAPAPIASNGSTATSQIVPQTTHSNQLQQQHHALLQHADSQLLPSHLKCGMCASLVLASVFVAGTKFYFDHQGTGLEVVIFCAFSATFFLAACLVSLCRIPKGLLSSSGRTESRAAVCHSRGIPGTRRGSGEDGTTAAGCLLEMSDVRYLEERQGVAGDPAVAAAGPPPYHIAILLPEQTSGPLGKQLPLDESPPPSYDKILV